MVDAVAELLDRHAVVSWTAAAVRDMSAARSAINEANVFPVADSDTGTNLLLTVSEGARAVQEAGVPTGQGRGSAAGAPGPGERALHAFARGALLGARGNSGIIVSEYLRGFAKAMHGAGAGSSGQLLADCLTSAASSAYAAVADPVQGTMLTAADGAARAADREARLGGSLEQVVHAACAGARTALARSPRELAVLAHNGVLDAGAYGLTLLLDGLAEGLLGPQARAVAGELPDLTLAPSPDHPDLPPDASALAGRSGRELDRELARAVRRGAAGGQGSAGQADPADAAAAEVDGEFEVMFVVELPVEQVPGPEQDELAEGLRERLRAIGESVVVVGGDGVWQAHVHTDDVPAALATVRRGRARQVCVRHLPGQLAVRPQPRPAGVVVGTGSPALVADLARTGAVVLLTTAEGWQPEEVVRAVVDADAPHVVVLTPPACVDAVRAAADLTSVALDVVEVPTDLHAVAALVGAELAGQHPGDVGAGVAGLGAADLGSTMRAAAARLLRWDVDAGPGRPPEGARWGAAEIADAVEEAVAHLRDDLAPEQALVLLLCGDDVDREVLDAIEAARAVSIPGAELTCLRTGRPGTEIQVGVL